MKDFGNGVAAKSGDGEGGGNEKKNRGGDSKNKTLTEYSNVTYAFRCIVCDSVCVADIAIAGSYLSVCFVLVAAIEKVER